MGETRSRWTVTAILALAGLTIAVSAIGARDQEGGPSEPASSATAPVQKPRIRTMESDDPQGPRAESCASGGVGQNPSNDEHVPDESSTGVPNGMMLRPSGSLTLEKPGVVVDGLDVRGAIDIHADHVTIRHSRISTGQHQYPIRIRPGVTGVLIEHVEVSNEGHPGKGIYFDRSGGTVRHANIHSAEDGIFITGDDVVVEHSYVHHLVATETSHNDVIQIRRGKNITIRNNNLQAFNDSTGDPMNAAIQIGSLVGDEAITNLCVTGNLMNGGNITVNGGRPGDLESALFSDNRFGRDFRYGVARNLPETAVWERSNVYHDTNEPAS